MMKGFTIGATAALALVFAMSAAQADVVTYKAKLDGKSESPATDSKGTGKASLKYDDATKKLTYTITYKDLTGPALGAHFHGPVEAGKNAGIVLPFKTVQSPIQGSATLTDEQGADLLAGKWYANVHTAANPGGELRGQMMK